MEADWEIEIGGGAPVIEALWPGFVDLRRSPERIGEIAEAAAFPALARLLLALNGAGSPLWTSKCDLWEPEAGELAEASEGGGGFNPHITSAESEGALAPEECSSRASLACYIDLLPLQGKVFAHWQEAGSFCREWVARLAQLRSISDPRLEQRIDLIVRQAIAGAAEGFGVTAYISAVGCAGAKERDQSAAAEALAAAMATFAAAIPPAVPPATAASKLQ